MRRISRLVALVADGDAEEQGVGNLVRGGDAVAVVDVTEDVEGRMDAEEAPEHLDAASVAGRVALPSGSPVAVDVDRASVTTTSGAF